MRKPKFHFANIDEVEYFINIGFNPKQYYSAQVWKKVEAVMNWLCSNTKVIMKYNFTSGKKYTYIGECKIYDWAKFYYTTQFKTL